MVTDGDEDDDGDGGEGRSTRSRGDGGGDEGDDEYDDYVESGSVGGGECGGGSGDGGEQQPIYDDANDAVIASDNNKDDVSEIRRLQNQKKQQQRRKQENTINNDKERDLAEQFRNRRLQETDSDQIDIERINSNRDSLEDICLNRSQVSGLDLVQDCQGSDRLSHRLSHLSRDLESDILANPTSVISKVLTTEKLRVKQLLQENFSGKNAISDSSHQPHPYSVFDSSVMVDNDRQTTKNDDDGGASGRTSLNFPPDVPEDIHRPEIGTHQHPQHHQMDIISNGLDNNSIISGNSGNKINENRNSVENDEELMDVDNGYQEDIIPLNKTSLKLSVSSMIRTSNNITFSNKINSTIHKQSPLFSHLNTNLGIPQMTGIIPTRNIPTNSLLGLSPIVNNIGRLTNNIVSANNIIGPIALPQHNIDDVSSSTSLCITTAGNDIIVDDDIIGGGGGGNGDLNSDGEHHHHDHQRHHSPYHNNSSHSPPCISNNINSTSSTTIGSNSGSGSGGSGSGSGSSGGGSGSGSKSCGSGSKHSVSSLTGKPATAGPLAPFGLTVNRMTGDN